MDTAGLFTYVVIREKGTVDWRGSWWVYWRVWGREGSVGVEEEKGRGEVMQLYLNMFLKGP